MPRSITRPLAFDGKDLFLNAVGPVEVEALTATGEPLGKAVVKGDSLRHRADFGARSLRDLAPDGSVRLRFSVSGGGRLYSFTID